MKGKAFKYSPLQLCSAAFMILALLWLTVSAPFVIAAQQAVAKHAKVVVTPSAMDASDEEAANPFGNTTEEKAPSNTTFSEEFLHDHHKTDYFFSVVSSYHKCENVSTYVAYHGELLVPPPNAA